MTEKKNTNTNVVSVRWFGIEEKIPPEYRVVLIGWRYPNGNTGIDVGWHNSIGELEFEYKCDHAQKEDVVCWAQFPDLPCWVDDA